MENSRTGTAQNAQQGLVCFACGAIYEKPTLTPTEWGPCPSCGLKALATHTPAQPMSPALHCDCGNALFNVTPDGVFCPRCGEYQQGVEVTL